MLKPTKRQFFQALLLLVAIFIVVGWESSLIPTNADVCTQNAQTKKEDCAAHNIAYFVLWSVGTFLENHNGAITAFATMFIAWFTWTLYGATTEQGRLTEQSIVLARDEFNASHRPIIQVRNVALANELEFSNIDVGAQVKGRVSVTNIGDTAATIVASHLSLYWSDSGLPPDPPYRGRTANNFCGSREIEAGGSIRAVFSAAIAIPNENMTGTFENVGPSDETPVSARKFHVGPNTVLYVMGWIKFKDGRNIKRQIGFCRQYDKTNRRFFPIDNPDYEYKA